MHEPRKTVLIVDDEPILALFAQEILSDGGYAVHVANTGREALDILKAEHVDLLFTDVMMPGITGIELHEIASRQGVKCALTTGAFDRDFIPSQDYAVLTKPYEGKDLLEFAQRVLQAP